MNKYNNMIPPLLAVTYVVAYNNKMLASKLKRNCNYRKHTQRGSGRGCWIEVHWLLIGKVGTIGADRTLDV